MCHFRWACVGIVAGMVLGLFGCGGEVTNEAVGVGPVSAVAVLGPAQTEQLLGDMDDDGAPSVADAIAILRIVVGLDPDSPRADADQDGVAGVADAVKMLRLVVGLDTNWPLAWQLAWVSGSVEDRFTGAGVGGVSVGVGDKVSVSDSDGDFCVKAVEIGDRSLSIDLEGTGAAPVAPLPATVVVVPPETLLGAIHIADENRLPPDGPDW